MIKKLPNPLWPIEVQEAFNDSLEQCASGCGSCTNAEWHSAKDKDEFYFVVAICRAGIHLPNGEPVEYCSSTNVLQPAATSPMPSLANSSRTPFPPPLRPC